MYRSSNWFSVFLKIIGVAVIPFAIYCGICGIFALCTDGATWVSEFTTLCGAFGDPVVKEVTEPATEATQALAIML